MGHDVIHNSQSLVEISVKRHNRNFMMKIRIDQNLRLF